MLASFGGCSGKAEGLVIGPYAEKKKNYVLLLSDKFS